MSNSVPPSNTVSDLTGLNCAQGLCTFLGLVLLISALLMPFLPIPGVIPGGALCLIALMNVPRMRLSARIIALVVVIFGLFTLTSNSAHLDPALQRAGFLAAFLVSLGLLSSAAERCKDVRKAATVVASQPQGSRYLFVTLGTHILSVFLNFGAASLMGSLLSRRLDELRQQKSVLQLTLALLRGFAAMPMWSPLALSMIITLSMVPEVSYLDILPWGLLGGAIYITTGYFISRGIRAGASVQAGKSSVDERAAILKVLLRVCGLVGATFGLYLATDLQLPACVFYASLAFSMTWILVQYCSGGVPAPTVTFSHAVNGGINEIVMVSGAGFLGVVIAQSIGALEVLPQLLPGMLPLIAASIPVLMVLGGLIALNPIVTASVLLGLLHPVWPQEQMLWLAVPTILGWGITASSSPFTANVLIATRLMGLSSATTVYRGNGVLTLLSLGVACVVPALSLILLQ
ncbi:hypothetical protein [Fodinicurvata sediminis]|uniref:hypothetical protein n=1 Tax=Fodinicurvata sediminis TaxID=1121832 RepID=UPI0004228054|nr:hypothetical protein [Fodinicurvata sediminis]